jgi:CBS domain-containing protein
MQQNTPVSQIMTPEVVVANPDNKFSQVKRVFLEYTLHHLPIVRPETDELIGIVSTHDVMKYFSIHLNELESVNTEYLDENCQITDLMTKNPLTVQPNTPIRDVADIFSHKHFHALPVVEDSKIKGIVSTRDLVQYLYKQYG